MKCNREKRESPAERKWQSDAEAARQRPWLFSEMNINNMTSYNRSTKIREITSIVPPSPTDTNRSGEGRIRRIEKHNLAAYHAPLFKIHNGLWSSTMPFKCVMCRDVEVKATFQHWISICVSCCDFCRVQNILISHASNFREFSLSFIYIFSCSLSFAVLLCNVHFICTCMPFIHSSQKRLMQ